MILAGQVASLLGVAAPAAETRLRALRRAGLVRDARRFDSAPPCEQITGAGLRAIASPLRAPQLSYPGGYQHDVGLGWLWLAARSGSLGDLRGVASERHMRSHDARAQQWHERFGVRLGGLGPAGQERFHYPDLVLETRSGRRVALELELTSKSPARREGILSAYAADPRIDGVVYLVDRPATGRAVSRSAARMGLSDLVHVQPVSFEAPGALGAGTRSLGRGRQRVLTAGARGHGGAPVR